MTTEQHLVFENLGFAHVVAHNRAMFPQLPQKGTPMQATNPDAFIFIPERSPGVTISTDTKPKVFCAGARGYRGTDFSSLCYTREGIVWFFEKQTDGRWRLSVTFPQEETSFLKVWEVLQRMDSDTPLPEAAKEALQAFFSPECVAA